ncbi:MauE/DoxX family redox-associated membrane protein [Nocardia sp. NPDC051570]|uniref:MauE/DoxX family redox-associated membrane protein n=1 Tax=Nocardia sp. NPDC051570 TaxID=3364324 RepID=UPI00378F21C0
MTAPTVAARAAIGVVFALAAISKTSHPARTEFRTAVTGLVPRARGTSAALLAAAVIATEWVIVVLLALPNRVTTVAGFGLAAITLAAFTTAIAAAIRRGTTTPCRCFGTSTRPVSRIQLARNIILLAVTATGVTTTLLAIALSTGRSTIPIVGLCIAAGTGALIGAVLTVFEDLADLFTTPTPPSAAATTRRSALP